MEPPQPSAQGLKGLNPLQSDEVIGGRPQSCEGSQLRGSVNDPVGKGIGIGSLGKGLDQLQHPTQPPRWVPAPVAGHLIGQQPGQRRDPKALPWLWGGQGMPPQGSWGSTTLDGEHPVTQEVASDTFPHRRDWPPCQRIPPRGCTEAERTNRPRAAQEGGAEQGHGQIPTRQHRFSTVPASCCHLGGDIQPQLRNHPGATLQPTTALDYGTIASLPTQPQHSEGSEFVAGSIRLIEIDVL